MNQLSFIHFGQETHKNPKLFFFKGLFPTLFILLPFPADCKCLQKIFSKNYKNFPEIRHSCIKMNHATLTEAIFHTETQRHGGIISHRHVS